MQKLEFEMKDLKEEIEHHKTIAASLKCMIKDRDNEATTPGDSTVRSFVMYSTYIGLRQFEVSVM